MPDTDVSTTVSATVEQVSSPVSEPEQQGLSRAAFQAGWLMAQLYGPVLDGSGSSAGHLPSVSELPEADRVDLSLRELEVALSTCATGIGYPTDLASAKNAQPTSRCGGSAPWPGRCSLASGTPSCPYLSWLAAWSICRSPTRRVPRSSGVFSPQSLGARAFSCRESARACRMWRSDRKYRFGRPSETTPYRSARRDSRSARPPAVSVGEPRRDSSSAKPRPGRSHP
jgi:hypothetical protein